MKGVILDIPSTIEYYLSQDRQPESFGVNKYAETLPLKNFTVISNEGGLKHGLPVKTDHYAIILCVSGTCSKTVGPFTFEVKPQSLHFVSPRYISSYQDASEDLLLYMVLFKRDFLLESFLREEMLHQLIEVNPEVPPLYQLDDDTFVAVRDLFIRLDQEHKSDKPFSLQMQRLQLVELLYEMGRACEKCLLHPGRNLSRQYYLVYSYKKLVDEHFLHKRTVQEYADMLNVSPGYLLEVVKRETGETALHLIHRRLYLEAQYLLTSSSYSIKEIAEQLEFDTSSHFSRFFKLHAGFVPSQFKERM